MVIEYLIWYSWGAYSRRWRQNTYW